MKVKLICSGISISKNSKGKPLNSRKILKNSLKDLIPITTYNDYINKRPEELSVNDYIRISNNI